MRETCMDEHIKKSVMSSLMQLFLIFLSLCDCFIEFRVAAPRCAGEKPQQEGILT